MMKGRMKRKERREEKKAEERIGIGGEIANSTIVPAVSLLHLLSFGEEGTKPQTPSHLPFCHCCRYPQKDGRVKVQTGM